MRILDEAAAREMQRFQFTDANRPENFPASDGNSGLFWRTKFRGQRVGHGGSDPGVQTEMLADRSGTLGVVLLVNTSLSGRDAAVTGSILDLLWRHGESLREARNDEGDDLTRARR